MGDFEKSADKETLGQELARLVREYEAAGEEAGLAWNMIADFTICNAEAICAALASSPPSPKAGSEQDNGESFLNKETIDGQQF